MLRDLAGTVAMAVLVSGCGSVEPLPPTAPPSDFRQMTATFIAGLQQPQLFKGALISTLQKSEGPQPGDWFACLRLHDQSFYVIFFRGKEVADFRRPVGVDKCPVADQLLPDPPKKKPSPDAPKEKSSPAAQAPERERAR